MSKQRSGEAPPSAEGAASPADSLQQLLDRHKLQTFYGDLHNHTSYSDGTGRPAEALEQMRARGLHFAAITEHGEFFDRHIASPTGDRWAAVAEQAAAYSSRDFIGIRGFEWTSPQQGHVNVWWSADYTGYLRTGGESMAAFYEWLGGAEATPGVPEVLAGFNHPGREAGCFDGCRYVPALDNRIVTTECFNKGDDYGEGYFRTLDQGWHVGAVGASDHHRDDWGSTRLPRTGVLARELTLAALQEALRSRHTFATRSATLKIVLTGNAQLMGSRLTLEAHKSLTLDVWCDDASISHATTRLEIWTNDGQLVDSVEQSGTRELRWQVRVAPQGARGFGEFREPGELAERWFVARLLHDGAPLGYSSPIWARWQ